MSSEYSHYDASYNGQFVENQTAPLKHTKNEVRQLPNPIYKHPVQFYDSVVKNSSIYPNLLYLKPVNYENRPSDIGGMIDKTIEDNKNFAFGPYVMPHRNLKSKGYQGYIS